MPVPEMIPIDRASIGHLVAKARLSKRGRLNLNFHPHDSDPLQRLLNAIEPGSYIQPHKHQDPDKTEAFIILQGRLAVVVFDDAGQITGHIILDPSDGTFGVEIPPRTWHMILALTTGTVVYEVKNGPYNPADDKKFAEWAPAETDTGTAEFLEKIYGDLNINPHNFNIH
jgi:cupin fold WbuC family metalloprotein